MNMKQCCHTLLGFGLIATMTFGAEDFGTNAAQMPQSTPEFQRLFPNASSSKLVVKEQEGIGFDDLEHSLQDPSNVIKVGDTYYVWMSWRTLNIQVNQGEISYATSKDGRHWENKGICFHRGEPGAWDDRGVYTPYVVVSGGKYYLFYSGIAKDWKIGDQIGLAVADSPDGPWQRVSDKPVLTPTAGSWDSRLVDDAHVIVRGGKFLLYYKGISGTDKWYQSRQSVAIADKIEGPYVKSDKNPVISKGQCACVWPHADGVTAISDLGKQILWSPDGLDFTMVNKGQWVGAGPGPYDPDAHSNTKHGGGIQWGVMQFGHPVPADSNRCVIARFDLDLRTRNHNDHEQERGR